MEKNTPIDFKTVKQKIQDSGLADIGFASIREIVKLVNEIEGETNQKFIRMEMGVPGLDLPEIAKNAEKEALDKGFASKYAMIEGVAVLKKEISRFVKLFLDIDIDPKCCVPTVGSLQGSMIMFLVANRTDASKEGTLFIDPGFPVQKLQCNVIGQKYQSFDVFEYRGEKLRDKLESYLKEGKVSSILYSNPNNPSWISFTENELKIIAELADKYNAIIIEDLAYFGMDFRKDYSQPGKAPYQPTIAKYTDNYVLLISSSKSFSYAGQRVGMLAISNKLFDRSYPDLKRYFVSDKFGYSTIYNALYSLSSGVPHTPQYGLAALLKAVNDGNYNFRDDVMEYGRRAKAMKKLFLANGFKLVYDNDEGHDLADGFYFTISYPGMTGSELLENLLYYGISAIALQTTGSTRTEGLRACVSQTSSGRFPELEQRLIQFNADFGK
jgi:aspartate/methionine/tyrosine aminotransferase